MKKTTTLFLSIAALIMFLFSCQMQVTEEIVVAGESTTESGTGSVSLGYQKAGNQVDGLSASILASVSTENLDKVRYIIVSIADSAGTLVEDTRVLTVVNLNGSFISEQVTLKSGVYTVEKYLVVDENHQVLFASPYKDSPLAVELGARINPLPLGFTVETNLTTNVLPEVVDVTEDTTSDAFGYTTFGFNIIDKNKEIVKTITKETVNQMGETETIVMEFDLEEKKIEETRTNTMYTGYRKTYEYDAEGILVKENYYNENGTPGVFNNLAYYTDYEYNSSSQLISEKKYDTMNSSSSDPAKTVIYTYDSTGDLITENKTEWGMDYETTYQYNALRQLIVKTTGGSGMMNYTYEYEYDAEGKKVTERKIESGDMLRYTATFEYDAEGRLIKANNCEISAGAGMTENGTIVYEYNAEGKLVKETITRDMDMEGTVYKTITYTYELY